MRHSPPPPPSAPKRKCFFYAYMNIFLKCPLPRRETIATKCLKCVTTVWPYPRAPWCGRSPGCRSAAARCSSPAPSSRALLPSPSRNSKNVHKMWHTERQRQDIETKKEKDKKGTKTEHIMYSHKVVTFVNAWSTHLSISDEMNERWEIQISVFIDYIRNIWARSTNSPCIEHWNYGSYVKRHFNRECFK